MAPVIRIVRVSFGALVLLGILIGPALAAGDEVRRPSVGDLIDRCVQDAKIHFPGSSVEELQAMSWPQVWPTSTTGFPGPGLQVITTAQTVVVLYAGQARVYHNGRFAYKVAHPTSLFWVRISEHDLPGATESRYRLGAY